MKQYWEIKSQHNDKILFFRMGDFFELFFDDATKAAPILGITLTSRNKKAQDETPMCGVPHHSIAGHINRLLSLGHKVAICDQVEDPKTAKGIVKRAVTRVLTPGMVYDVESLDQTKPHYLASFDDETVSFLDVSTGEAFWVAARDWVRQIRLHCVVELVITPEQKKSQNFLGLGSVVVSEFEDSQIQPDSRAKHLSCLRLLSYVKANNSTQDLSFVQNFIERKLQGRLLLTTTTQRHLELFLNSKNEKQNSLFSVLDRSQTSAGSRKIREWLQFPLLNLHEIEDRLNSVEFYLKDPGLLKNLRQQLSRLGDLERRLAKISQASGHARDLQALAEGIMIALSALESAKISFDGAHTLRHQAEKILHSVVDEPPLLLKSGGLIRKGVDPTLDELIRLSTDSHQILSDLEAQEKQDTGISSLKIRYNNVFGYYIEITHTHKEKVPAHYKRKQTLATAERFYTEELLELEKKILSADLKRAELEYEIFDSLKIETLKLSGPISWLAQKAGELDAWLALAWLALENNYTRPQFSKKFHLQLSASRHPVVEKSVPRFVANDLELKPQHCLLLTGPNMAGKSTLMRQVALISIMAQMGSFVPASRCQIPIYDQIFTRIGAQDQLSDGLSTFMVEMTETAELLRLATSQSLVILDEIGRGTSTYDGLSLAEAILEYLLKKDVAQVLFATHYHEMTTLDQKYQNLINAHMSVVEKSSHIEFLHSLVLKPAGRSYGIQVAKLAGLPEEIIQMALSKEGNRQTTGPAQQQLSFVETQDDAELMKLKLWAEKIKNYPVLEKSPLESLGEIQKWQKEL